MTTTSSPTASVISIHCRRPSGSLHFRIPPPARPTRNSPGHFRARGQFADVVTAKTLGGDDSQLHVPLADDLALFADVQVTTCASSAARGVIRNGYNGCQSLNVWVSLRHGRKGRFLLTASSATLRSAAQAFGACDDRV